MELDQVINASTVVNASLNGTEAKLPPTPEGLILSSTILFIMAIIPIYLGSQRSTRINKYLPTDYINLLVSLHFTLIGINGLVTICCPLMMCLTPVFIAKYMFHFEFTGSRKSGTQWEITSSQGVTVNGHDIPGIILSIVIGALYLFTKVFGTPVMVSVAKNLDAPIKVVFPRDFLSKGIFGQEMALLGLGDIVLPGIFIAMLLRFDKHLNRGNDKLYFYTGYMAYIIGLLVTFLVMHTFKSAQPALLYLVPACLGAPALVALLKGDMNAMLEYRDESNSEDEKKEVESDSILGTGSDSAIKKNE